jgi:hypothetical protein
MVGMDSEHLGNIEVITDSTFKKPKMFFIWMFFIWYGRLVRQMQVEAVEKVPTCFFFRSSVVLSQNSTIRNKRYHRLKTFETYP